MLDFLTTLPGHLIEWIRHPGTLIAWGGYPALCAVVFLETGLLVFFLPGDSLLVVAGFYAAQGSLNVWLLNLLLGPLAVLGDAVAYAIGKQLSSRPRRAGQMSRLLRPEHLATAQQFYERHGGKAVVLARFVPVVRTFVPIVAGMARMPYRDFARFNILGGLGWVGSMTLTGYFLGSRFPILLDHLEKVIIVIVALSILPAIIEFARAERGAHKGPHG